eukprot:TRINITY_DN52903_c0_g1_i1.p1 TRINITY_DN52903_c0_g1~~TRINITY_DN52903_c0_g1_i1.p1  ORF type:complete len:253 (+),score=33.56 TRINITY_DN52903_c0_g1_i1:91-849(+)
MIGSYLWDFSFCCSCNDPMGGYGDQVSCVMPNPRLDEGLDQSAPFILASSSGQMPPRMSSGPALSSGIPMSARSSGGTGVVGSAPTTARSLSGEDRQKEKERMQDLVKEFAKSVVQGQPCHFLPDTEFESLLSTGGSSASAPRPAQYALDKSLRNFSVRSQDSVEAVIPMASVVEVMKDVRETPLAGFDGLPPPHLLSGDALERRFVCMSYVMEDTHIAHIALLLPDQHERERFYTCMKILRWALDCKRERS